MFEDFRWWVWGAGVGAVALVVGFGPLVAAFAFAAVSFALMLALMGAGAARLLGNWRLEHPRIAHLPLRVKRVR